MANFIEFPVFDGVSRDLRPWILWLEDFFVREKFTALEKMNLAQSLLAGEVEAWFYSQKRSIFRSWEHLMDLLIWRFGDLSDPALFRLWDKNARLLQKRRVEKRRKKMATTSLNLQESIYNQQKIVEESDSIEKDESSSAKDESMTQTQVPISSLEPGLSFSSEILDVSVAWPSKMVSINRVHSQAGLECVKNKNNAHHVFDELFRILHDPGGQKDEHSDDIVETEVDIDNVQRPQVDTVAESVVTTPENVAASVITAPAIVASSSNDAASYTDVITKRQRWDEACDAEIDVLDGTATWIVTSQPANIIEEAPGNRLLAIQQNETVSAYVTAFAELSTQVIALEDSHLEQIFNEELKTELQEVLKLKTPVGLENPKKNRCLKASRFLFKRKKKRIKRWFNTLSCRESWRKHKHDNLQIVSGLVGFNVGDFRCHKEYGLARMGNWSQVRVEYSLLQGELFCKNTLPRKPATSSSMLPLYVYQMGVSDIQDNDKEMVADPVSLQLILDDLKSHLRHKWKSKHLRAVYPQTNPSYALDVVNKSVIECTNDRVIATALERQAVLEQLMKGVRPVLLHNPFPMISRVGILVLLARRVFQKLAAPLLKVLKSWMFKYKPQLEPTVCTFDGQTDHVIFLAVIGEHQQVQSSDPPTMLPEDLWIPAAILESYHAFKLEDKLVFGEGSIDTIKQSYCRRKREESVFSNKREASGCFRSFAVLVD